MAAEGMDLPNSLAALRATDPEAAATAILRLHDDAAACDTLAAAGLAFIGRAHAATRVDEALFEAIGARPAHG